MSKPIKTYPIKSASRNKFHLVQDYGDGRMSCTCEYYQFKGYQDTLGTCSHIKKIKLEYGTTKGDNILQTPS